MTYSSRSPIRRNAWMATAVSSFHSHAILELQKFHWKANNFWLKDLDKTREITDGNLTYAWNFLPVYSCLGECDLGPVLHSRTSISVVYINDVSSTVPPTGKRFHSVWPENRINIVWNKLKNQVISYVSVRFTWTCGGRRRRGGQTVSENSR